MATSLQVHLIETITERTLAVTTLTKIKHPPIHIVLPSDCSSCEWWHVQQDLHGVCLCDFVCNISHQQARLRLRRLLHGIPKSSQLV